uniref:LIM zinc-binding domain-containing protein n=1 Tax=Panagrellus redivivus TaxID=6233 RepID=A0A7E4ZY04_PANRE
MFICQACNKPITEFDVQEGAAVMALDAAWHRKHIACVKCGANVGDERRRFVATKAGHRKMAMCIDCHMEAENPNCAVCDRQLFENCIEAEGKKMHHLCFTCERCKAPFEEGQYALIGGKPYDLDCWYFKQYEAAFANGQNSMLFDFSSPPPNATGTDSSSSGPTVCEDPPTFQRKTTELCALLDIPVAPTSPKDKSKESLSGEIMENDPSFGKGGKDKRSVPDAPKASNNDDLKALDEIKHPLPAVILPPPLSPPGEKKKRMKEEPIVPLFSPASSPGRKQAEAKAAKDEKKDIATAIAKTELLTSTATTTSGTTGTTGSTNTTTSSAGTGATTTSGLTATSTHSSSSESVSSIIVTTSDTTLTGPSLLASTQKGTSTVSVASTQPATATVSVASTQDGGTASIASDGSGAKAGVQNGKEQPLSPAIPGSSPAITPTAVEPGAVAQAVAPVSASIAPPSVSTAPTSASAAPSSGPTALPVYLTYPIIAGLSVSHVPTAPSTAPTAPPPPADPK